MKSKEISPVRKSINKKVNKIQQKAKTNMISTKKKNSISQIKERSIVANNTTRPFPNTPSIELGDMINIVFKVGNTNKYEGFDGMVTNKSRKGNKEVMECKFTDGTTDYFNYEQIKTLIKEKRFKKIKKEERVIEDIIYKTMAVKSA